MARVTAKKRMPWPTGCKRSTGIGTTLESPGSRNPLKYEWTWMTVTFNDVEELGKRCDRLPTDFKIGDVRRMTSGMGSCWVRRPVDAGKKLINGGTTDHRRVVQLQGGDATCARPPMLQMLGGHVQSKCTSLVNRSSCCYRCGAIGQGMRRRQARLP